MNFFITPVVKNLIILNLIVFLAYNVLGILPQGLLSMHTIGTDQFEPYQFVASFFTHSDISHILWNMILLMVFGRILEQMIDSKDFGIIYLATGIGGIIFDQLVKLYLLDFQIPNDDPFLGSVGASGAVMGVIMALTTYNPNLELRFILIPIPIRIVYIAAFFVGKDVIAVINPQPEDLVAHFIHLGGAITGFLMMKFWYKRFR